MMITVATDGDDAIVAMKLAQSDDRIYFSSGIHPLHADGDWNWEKVQQAGRDTRCVAWGELGLDRHHAKPPFNLQLKLLEEHFCHLSMMCEVAHSAQKTLVNA